MSGVTVVCAGRSGYNRNIIVSERINNLLCNDNLGAYGAMTALRKTGLGAGSVNRIVSHFNVTFCKYDCAVLDFAAVCTFKVSFLSVLGTGRSLIGVLYCD